MAGCALRSWRRVVVRMGLVVSSGAFRPRPRTCRGSFMFSFLSSGACCVWVWFGFVVVVVDFFADMARCSSSGGKWLTQLEQRSSIRPFLGRVSA